LEGLKVFNSRPGIEEHDRLAFRHNFVIDQSPKRRQTRGSFGCGEDAGRGSDLTYSFCLNSITTNLQFPISKHLSKSATIANFPLSKY
jgi:hypothetical protein